MEQNGQSGIEGGAGRLSGRVGTPHRSGGDCLLGVTHRAGTFPVSFPARGGWEMIFFARGELYFVR